MKTLYLDCSMGAAGDMISAALLELMPDPDAAIARLNSIGIPGVIYTRERTSRCGIAATHLAVTVNGEEECAHEHHDHAHHHHHAHSHRSLDDMLHIAESLTLPQKAKEGVAAVYRLLADAESRAHGRPVGEVHFHEVGAMDAIADIAATCWLMSELAPGQVVVSPVNVGGGTVRCAHGVMPVPAPATAFLLEGIPSRGDAEVQCELCTPTGAALLRHLASSFGPMPAIMTHKVGFGAGKRDFEGRANLLRATLGESAADGDANDVVEIRCNIDDMTGEDIAFACEQIFNAGALDVLTIPATMKKGRPGVMLDVLCDQSRREDVATAIFRHTSTLGIRESVCRRTVLSRREEPVPLSDGTTARRKVSEGRGIVRSKLEHDDLAAYALAHGISIAEARAKISANA